MFLLHRSHRDSFLEEMDVFYRKASRHFSVCWLVLVIGLSFAVPGVQAQTNHPPNTPVLVSPANGATGIGGSTDLTVTATDPDANPLKVTFYGRKRVMTSDFVIAVFGDTQNYYLVFSDTGKDFLKAQTDWVVANRTAKNIAFVAHVGDVVSLNQLNEWIYTSNAIAPLEDAASTGLTYGIPFDLGVGNHDQQGGTSLYNTYFGINHFSGRSYYGGPYSTANNDNHYDLFSAGGTDFIVIEMAFGPDTSVLTWANQLLKTYSDRRAIVISHDMIQNGDPAPWDSYGQTIYNSLKANPNLFLMLCGHNGGDGKRTDVYNGNTVYTLMADYSGDTNGGNGYIRLLNFSAANNNIHVETYSPTAGTRTSSPVWDLPFQLGPAFSSIGSLDVASGSTATATYGNLSQDTQYEWYTTVSDGTATTTGPRWTFSTLSSLPPSAPSGLTATAVPTRQANLSWTDNATNETEFEIFRSSDGTNFGSIATVGANVVSYSDSGLTAGVTYYYKVRANNQSGQSSFSNVGSVTIASTIPTAPSNLSATVVGNQINLKWTDASSNEDGFEIEHSEDGISFHSLATVASNTTAYSDNPASSGTNYYYRVRSFNSAGYSSYTNMAYAAVWQLTLVPVADTTIRPDDPTGNYGTDTELKVDGDPVKKVLLKFTVSGVGGRTISSSSLRIWVSTDGSAYGGSFYRVADSSWTETGVNWNNAPAANPTPFATLSTVRTGTWYSVDLAGQITGDGTYSFMIASTNSDGVYYSSKEGPNPPQLIVSVQGTANVAPVGAIDEIRQSDGVARGWAYDPDSSTARSQIQIYVDGAAGQGTLLSKSPTSVLRADINSSYGISGTHGFEYLIPAQFRDNASHSVYVYAVDSSNPLVTTLLAGSPKSFTLAPPATAAFRFASWGDAQDGGTASFATSNKIADLNPSFTIFNGDLSDDGAVLDPSSAYSMQLMSNALRGNQYGVGTLDNGVFLKTFLVRGNHDNHYVNPDAWQTFFSSYTEAQGTVAARVIRIGGNEYTFMIGQDALTFSFDYSNSRFISVDVPGGSLENLTSAQVSWIDARLTDAELNHPELAHAFLNFHGALYCLNSFHCDCAAQRLSCLGANQNLLVNVINKHPIVTALFHGHEHNLGWTHLDSTRIPSLTHSVEQFITSPAGQPTMNQYVQFDPTGTPYRFDYVETATEDQAFGIIDVIGSSYSVSLYRSGNSVPVWSVPFTKVITPLATAPSNLSATSVSGTEIALSWTYGGSATDTIHIQRSVDSGSTWDEIGTTGGSATAYSDNTLTAGTSAVYRLRASNATGYSSYSNTATATTAPAVPVAPTALSATAISSTQIDLSWTDNSTNESEFKVERSTDGTTWSQIVSVGADVAAYSNTGLDPAKNYSYRVRASNSAGDSEYTNSASATTQDVGPATPSGLTAAANGSDKINLSWIDNANNETSFKIERSSEGSQFVEIATVAENVTAYTNSGLSPGKTYSYRVLAINAIGNSGYSNTASATTAQVIPAAPTSLTATSIGSTQIDLSWTDASDNEDTFEIQQSSNGVTYTALATLPANSTTYSHTGLTANTKYYYQVQATNSAGPSEFSNTASATTNQVAPAAPTGLAATANGSTQINLLWTDNSTNETGFKVERSTDGTSFAEIATLGENITSYNNTGLNPGTTYYYKVRASNAAGDSAYSNTANAKTDEVLPAAPSGLAASTISSTQINLSWVDNSNNETGFKIERSTDNGPATVIAVGANSSSYNDTGLNPATKYYYRVAATNSIGDSTYTSTVGATTNDVVPSSPTGLTATAFSSTQINLTWTDNANNESGFKVEMSTDGTTFAEVATVGANITAYNSTGLTPATKYYYRVAATNTVGDSVYSDTANATTKDIVPAAPTDLAATAVSGTQINLSWVDNSNNETEFKLERSTDGVSFTEIATVGTNITSYSNTGLNPATTYYYQVRAHNAIGYSDYSNVVQAKTLEVAPAAPTNLTATAAGSDQIHLTWTDNSNNETGFKIERSTDGSSFAEIATLGENITSYNNTGLNPGTTYYYKVRASNTAGDSVYSGIASAKTNDVAPAAPSGLTANAVSGTQINLSWVDNSNNETEFKIERSTDGALFTQIASVGANITSYSNTGLNPATTYYFRVRSYNAIGPSDYSNVVSTTTLEVAPTAPTNLTATAAGSDQINLAWTDNSTNETGFKIERSADGASFTQIATVSANVTAYSSSSLMPGTTYYYRVRATNSVGDSAYSNVSNATTIQVPPASPTGLSATAASTAQINLAWIDNSNNETGFRIERSSDGITFAPIATVGSNVTSYSNTGLNPGTMYYYRVIAYNSADDSANYSNTASAATPLVAPSNLSAKALSRTQIALSWRDNSNNEQGFTIQRSTDGKTFLDFFTTSANVTSYTVSSLSSGTKYWFRVRAYNAVATSNYSSIASASTKR